MFDNSILSNSVYWENKSQMDTLKRVQAALLQAKVSRTQKDALLEALRERSTVVHQVLSSPALELANQHYDNEGTVGNSGDETTIHNSNKGKMGALIGNYANDAGNKRNVSFAAMKQHQGDTDLHSMSPTSPVSPSQSGQRFSPKNKMQNPSSSPDRSSTTTPNRLMISSLKRQNSSIADTPQILREYYLNADDLSRPNTAQSGIPWAAMHDSYFPKRSFRGSIDGFSPIMQHSGSTPGSRGTVGLDLRNEVEAVNKLAQGKMALSSTLDIYLSAIHGMDPLARQKMDEDGKDFLSLSSRNYLRFVQSPSKKPNMLANRTFATGARLLPSNDSHHRQAQGAYDFVNHKWGNDGPPDAFNNKGEGWRVLNRNAGDADFLFAPLGSTTSANSQAKVHSSQDHRFPLESFNRFVEGAPPMRMTQPAPGGFGGYYSGFERKPIHGNDGGTFNSSMGFGRNQKISANSSTLAAAWMKNRSCLVLSKMESDLADDWKRLTTSTGNDIDVGMEHRP